MPAVGNDFKDCETCVLHHRVLSNGDMVDCCVQNTDHELLTEPMIALGYRDGAFDEQVVESPQNNDADFLLSDRGTGRKLITDIWLNLHKHCKVLHRDLDRVCRTGLHFVRSVLM